MIRGLEKITLAENQNKEINGEDVVKWCKEAICEYFRINEKTLGEKTRARTSSYPRQLFWYFGRAHYGLANHLLLNIAGEIFEPPAVTIQSEMVILQKHYNESMKYDIDEIAKILKKREIMA